MHIRIIIVIVVLDTCVIVDLFFLRFRLFRNLFDRFSCTLRSLLLLWCLLFNHLTVLGHVV